MTKHIKIFTPSGSQPDQGAIDQLDNCLASDAGVAGVLSADHHLGYSAPIGATIAYRDMISPSGVGYDIGCGNMAVSTSIFYQDIRADLPKIMDEIARRIGFGMGRPNNEPVDHPILEKIWRDAPTQQIRDLGSLAKKQLGTVGSGNHYVDLFREEKTDRIWIGVHFGSRGFGHKIASGFLAMSQNLGFNDHAPDGGLFDPPTLLDTRAPLGYTYAEAMKMAGEYAYAGRETVVAKVLEILGNPAVTHTVHNHHNFAWEEEHFGEKLWVVRKGATPLFPGQQGFVGGSMGENAVIIEGFGTSGSTDELGIPKKQEGPSALWSAPHGAGRQMSRTQAAGKRKKRWVFPDGHVQQPGEQAPADTTDLKKVWVETQKGEIDWNANLADLKSKGIELRGGAADEAPGAYKRLPQVLEAHKDYVKVVHQLRPIGVAMAGAGTTDPYRD